MRKIEKEEEYFARLEFERRQKAAEAETAKLMEKEREELKTLHWMRCPKDGMELFQIELKGVSIDKCSHCGGIYLDAGELDQLLATGADDEGGGHFLTHFLSVFSGHPNKPKSD